MKLLLVMALFISSTAFAQLKVSPGTIEGFDQYPEQLDKIHKSFDVIEAVINSQEFKERVVSYKGQSGKGYTESNNLSNQQVYDFLMTGKELINGEATQGEINFDLKRHYFGWYFNKKVVAETAPGVNNTVKLSQYFYSFFDVHQMAANLTHEWIHLMGFYHVNSKAKDSVPYAVGNIMGELAEKYMSQGYLE